MTPTRLGAAAAAVLTCMLLQATLIGPLTAPFPICLTAVLIGAVGLTDGPGTGMSLGFSAGVVADLGSAHPIGVLALGWLAVGAVCGMAADPRRKNAARAWVVATACALSGAFVTLLMALLGLAGANALIAARDLVPSLFGNALLALLVVPLVRRFLRTEALRASRVAYHPGLSLPSDSVQVVIRRG